MAAAAGGGAVRALSQKEQDIQMMLAADVHLGTKNCDFQMERYVFKRRTDGTCLHSRIPAFSPLRMRIHVDVDSKEAAGAPLLRFRA
jgi:small subunit ribosomal protein SAe